jgi:hypothetical protein
VQKPEDIEAVVDADHDDIAAPRQIGAVGDRTVARSIGKGAAMQPHHDRALAAVAKTRRPQIEGQAVFALGRRVSRAEQGFEHRAPLWPVGQLPGAVAIGERVAHPRPRGRWLGPHKAVIPSGRGAIGHALERVDPGLARAAQFARGDLDDRRQAGIGWGDVVGHAFPPSRIHPRSAAQ